MLWLCRIGIHMWRTKSSWNWYECHRWAKSVYKNGK